MSNVAKKKKAEEERRSRGQVINTPLYRYVNQLIGNYDSHCRGRGRGRRGNYRGRWQRHRSDFRRGSAEESDNNNTTHTTVIHPLTTPNGSHTSPTTDITSIDSDHTHFTPAETTHVTNGNMKETKEKEGTSKQTKRGTKRRHKQSRRTASCSDNDKKAKMHCHWTELPLMNRPSLLEKLLASSMRSEHNAILQCVRYIVQNNFFDQPKINGHCSATNGDGTDTEDTVTKDTISEESVTDQDTITYQDTITKDSVTPDTVTGVKENIRD